MKQLYACAAGALAIGLVMGASALAHAAAYGSAGCGLGSMLISDPGFMQVFAGTTNGTSGNQTFGITSGTSNCGFDGAIVERRAKDAFAEATLPRLTRDMAQGGGEYLDAFAELFGCSKDVRPAFNDLARANLQSVYPTTRTTAQELVTNFRTKVVSSPVLLKSCSSI